MIDWLFVIILGMVFLASLWPPAKTRVPTAVIEIILGILLVVSLGVLYPQWKTEAGHEWFLFLASMGAIAHIFLAGTETKLPSLKGEKGSIGLGKIATASLLSFMVPFILATAFGLYVLNWSMPASLLTGLALAETSIAVIYVVLVEGKLTETKIGSAVLATTFITNILVAVTLGIVAYFLFPAANPWAVPTVYFVGLTAAILVAAWFLRDRYRVFVTRDIGTHFARPLAMQALKLSLLLIFIFGLVAEFGTIAAILPAYLLGFILGPALRGNKAGEVTPEMGRFRTFHFAIFAPVLFIYAGTRVTYEAFLVGAGIVTVLFLIKVLSKFFVNRAIFGGFPLTSKDANYGSLLLATGLTLGTVIGLIGLQAGVLTDIQFSIIEAAIVLSAVIPTLLAERLFRPRA